MKAHVEASSLLNRGAALIAQGAEARILKFMFGGRTVIVKERFAKKYRHPELDERLTKQRLRAEARIILRCMKAGVRVPSLYHVDVGCARIFMELIDGVTCRDYLRMHDHDPQVCRQVAVALGASIARLHLSDVVHGDLTTSNVFIRNGDPSRPVLIDFGLAYVSNLPEDKGVDLHVMEQAFESTHARAEELVAGVLEAYRAAFCRNANGEETLKRLDAIRLRGRKRTMVG